MNENPLALLPEAILLGGAVVTLLVGMFAARSRQWVALAVAVAAALGSGVVAAVTATDHQLIYDGSYAVDTATAVARMSIAGAATAVLVLARGRVADAVRETEFYVLVLLASTGAVVLAGTSDLMLLAAGYLLSSIPLYALAGWARDPAGAEATLKTYVVSALMSILMMLGIAVLIGTSGGHSAYAQLSAGLGHAPTGAVALGYIGVLAGLLFKMGAVPAHFWVPDAVSGATVPAAAFLTTIPKIGGLIAGYRLLSAWPDTGPDWRLLIAILAAASMTLGNLAAFRQDDVKRLLAYSTISQVGYLLMPLAVAGRTGSALPALLTYLVAYAASNIGAFAVLAARPGQQALADWRGTGREHPALAAVLTVCLLGLVGTPPTAVFIGKLAVFTATWRGGLAWLVAVAAVNTIASLYYYLRWLAPALLPRSDAGPSGAPRTRRLPAVVAYATGVVALIGGVTGAGLVDATTLLR